MVKAYTQAQLGRSDGKDGRPAWIAFRGKVYDVSECFLWKGGRHMAMHEAGQDLTHVLEQAPHGEELLERARLIGILEEPEPAEGD
jgi:predicted heme/steroid binding protein